MYLWFWEVIMRIMVCGGAGFIGSHFIDYILNKYPEDFVLCYDLLTYAGKVENLKNCKNNKNFAFIKGDICDKAGVERAVKQYNIDTVVNFAAQSHVDRSIDSPDEFLRTNVLGVNTLLQVVKEQNLNRFHQVSTDEVYGDIALDDFVTEFTESSPIAPSSAYSASKASADLLVLAQRKTFNLPVTISRCGNNYGTRQHEEKLIPHFVMQAVNNNSLPLYGDGKNVRDWIHVLDHVKAIDLILRKGELGEVYNVGASNLICNLDIAKAILDILQKPHSLITFVSDRLGHDRKYSVNFDKIKKLGFKPEMQFESCFKECVLAYKDKFLNKK